MRYPLLLLLFVIACDDGPGDSPPADGGHDATVDATARDAEAVDASPRDARPRDASRPDAQLADLGRLDGTLRDAGLDAGLDSTVDATLDATVDAVVDAEVDAIVDMGLPPHPLRLNEAMGENDGAWVDTIGEADDWLELYNAGPDALRLTDYRVGDDDDFEGATALPDVLLGPGEHLVLFADDTPEQGRLHLPFKISARGETLHLWTPEGTLIDRFVLPAAQPNDSFQRYPDGVGAPIRCQWATPNRSNGERCGPPPPPEIPEEVEFTPYEWADPWPFPPTPLAVTEIALRPAAFVEVLNVTDAEVDLAGLSLRLAPHAPGLPWPGREEGVALAWPEARLAPGARLAVPVAPADTAALEADPVFEGVLTLWAEGREFPVERVDFMRWPEGAALTRLPDATGRHVFCGVTTRGAANEACDPLPGREVGDRLRHLRTPGDHAGLARGGVATGIESVKYVQDLVNGDVVHLLSAGRWDLHYTFVREVIEGQPHLSRCIPQEENVFNRGWSDFSRTNYFQVEGRHYLLGTLVHHGGAGVHTLEYTPGDRISPAQMRRAFFTAAGHVMDHRIWSLRPQTGDQVEKMLTLDGQVPMVGPNAPFRGLRYQPLTETVGYGVLEFVPVEALDAATLGPRVIVVTDQVPNDIALVGGLITEAFQTPLAHVNLLSRNRDTPNMALTDARNDPRIAPMLGRLVRLEVRPGGFDVEVADPAEAQAFWDARRPQGPPAEPRLDREARGVVPLQGLGIAELPRVGAKAAQLAELTRVDSRRDACPGPLGMPLDPMAIPLVHSLEHYEASGARALLTELQADPRFSDPQVRAAGLLAVRARILQHPVDPILLAQVSGYMADHYGQARVRFRSSSNTEDLPGFNGAGLYTSTSAELGDPERTVEDAIRVVWASLYNTRAYDEREFHAIAQEGVAMGILVHPAFLSERANGVAISRNIIDPIRDDAFINVQKGEATVTNPAPGVVTEQIIYKYRRQPRLSYLGRSNLTEGAPVLAEAEIPLVACTLKAIHDHFRPLIDPQGEDRWFAMDIEFKLVGPERALMIKQARPYSFGSREVPADCREL